MTRLQLRIGSVMALAFVLASLSHAGGPRYIAGSSFFDPPTKGQPIIWAQGHINYYTDQGNLSSLLSNSAADAFVADAFTRWTAISTAAISAARAGQLDEDVSGANVFVNADGSVSSPADILPDATATAVAIVYDANGQVTDALLGQGAGGSSSCFTNAVFGGPDQFSSAARITHALVVLNGNCAQTNSQLIDLKYRLVRTLGRVFGLDWSQTILHPTQLDQGFSLMHATDPVSCVPITTCYVDPDHPKMDDRAALSRLYPVTSQNISSFAGKQLFHENTVQFRGSVRFSDESGNAGQPMQGVNVVARWIDRSTGGVSQTFVASSVSGFRFRGNAGNPVTGYVDELGQPLDQYGSDDPALEGFFDLEGLEVPDGADEAEYQIALEPVDPLLSQAVGPYQPWQVQPSGTPPPLTVTIRKGTTLEQDIVMRRGAPSALDWFGPQDFANPAVVPAVGEWTGSLSGYGDTDYFSFPGRSNRTLSIEVTALDEWGTPSQNKARPVIGIWSPANPNTPAPLATPNPFNTFSVGMSRLDVSLLSSTDFRIGIADARGDGRPDFRYRARLFYADTTIPPRASAGGGTPLAIRGFGFHSNTQVSVGTTNAAALAITANQILTSSPPVADGLRTITLTDPATGSSSVMTDVIIFGAAPTDTIKLLSGTNPSTPVGGEAPNPIRLQVVDQSGVNPVAGASVRLSSAPAIAFSACNGATTCTTLSDESGQVASRLTPLTGGTATITAQLAPSSFSGSKQVQTTLFSTTAALDVSLAQPSVWIAQGASLDLPLQVKVLASGSPASGQTVNYRVTQGIATIAPATASTNTSGLSSAMLHISSIAAEIQISACVGQQNNPCRIFHIFPVPQSSLRLEPVARRLQVAAVGQPLQPVTMRVFDSATGNPVGGASVNIQLAAGRPSSNPPVISIGDTNITPPPLPSILWSSQQTRVSDGNGLVVVLPTNAGIPGVLVIQGTATIGVASLPFEAKLLGR